MIFRGRKLSEITQEHLQRLVDDQVQERDTVEYKAVMYGSADDDKREMLKDISAMANHRGGYLIIGLEEDEEGIPTKVVGVETGNHVERITGSCLDNIDKRIVGLDVADVQLSDDRVTIIVSIPESMNAPHMVTLKGLNQFWKRHGRQKGKMTIDEIGEAFERRLSNLNRLDRFLFERTAELLESIGDKPRMVLSATPAYLRDEVVFDIHSKDLRAIIATPPSFRQGRSSRISCGQSYVTLTGLRADKSTPQGHLEVFRNGYIEHLNEGLTFNNELCIAGSRDAIHIMDFVLFIKKVYGTFLPMTPLVVSLAIYNAKGIQLLTKDSLLSDQPVRWQKQHLELGKFHIEDLAAEAQLLAKRINDRLWQAFHHDSCSLFDAEGNLIS